MPILVKTLHGDDQAQGNIGVALELLDKNGDGKIDFEEFQDMNKTFPAILYPAFRTQVRLRLTFGFSAHIFTVSLDKG